MDNPRSLRGLAFRPSCESAFDGQTLEGLGAIPMESDHAAVVAVVAALVAAFCRTLLCDTLAANGLDQNSYGYVCTYVPTYVRNFKGV